MHGAEAVLRKEGRLLVKDRIKKGYRIHQLDEKIRKARTKAESKLLREARRAGVLTPHIIDESGYNIKMEFIAGKKVKDILDKNNMAVICRAIGESVAKLHNRDIIHGDLTTSNMILKGDKLYIIDFGLGFFSSRPEDKATDLRLLKQALESTHFSLLPRAWQIILNAYRRHYPSEEVIKVLQRIEKRGRYKER